MKIEINYDLIDKINEAKTGFSLQKYLNNTLNTALFASTPGSIYYTLTKEPEMMLENILFALTLTSLTQAIAHTSVCKINKKTSLFKLAELSKILNKNHINTDLELLLKSYIYSTNYKININEKKLPYILQEKYIFVPTYEKSTIKDVSLLQEHQIGTDKYYLSHGTKTKVLKLSYNSI